jgi:hypothetical protein
MSLPMTAGLLPDRNVRLRDVLDGLDEQRRARTKAFRELAHAVMNSLFVLKITAEAALVKRHDPAMHDVLEAANQIERLLGAYAEEEHGGLGLLRLPRERIAISAIAAAVRASGREVAVAGAGGPPIARPLALASILREVAKLELDGDDLVLDLVPKSSGSGSSTATTRAVLASVGASVGGAGDAIRARIPTTTSGAA